MDQVQIRLLIQKAKEAKAFSYSPYSHFAVGAALLTKDGQVYTGCNIENGAYTPTNCAERTAVFKAVSEGQKEFEAIAVLADRAFTPPCGVCLQVLAEFCDAERFQVILAEKETGYKLYRLKDLLPLGFSL